MVVYEKRSQTFSKNTITAYMSEDPERLSLFRSYRGWNTIKAWMDLAVTENVKNYFETLKKYSLLREYQRSGFDVSKILQHPKFDFFTASDIYRLIRAKVDKINTVILVNEKAENMAGGNRDELIECMKTPDIGVRIPFSIQNDIFRGYKLGSLMAVGMVSNSGKSREMMFQAAYLAYVQKQRVLVLLNEMSINEMRHCLITTVINNPEFQALHGVKISKREKELVLGLYKNDKGEYITPYKDDEGNVVEPIDEYIARVASGSKEYCNVMKIMDWLDNNQNGLLLVKDIAADYSDQAIAFEVRKAAITQGVKYWFFDTFKGDLTAQGDWAAIKVSATKLSQLCKDMDLFGYISIQLTDDVAYLKPDELTSNNISECKKIKHILDTFVMFKEVAEHEKPLYGYIARSSDWGAPTAHKLEQNRRYYIGNVDKNRFGRKTKMVYDINLDTNVWSEVGELIKK